MRPILAVVLTASLSACQTYDFEPVSPLAIAQQTQDQTVEATSLTANVLVLLDTSRSMADGSPSRISEVASAMDRFLASSGSLARFGLVKYPKGQEDECASASVGDMLVALPRLDAADSATDQQQAADEVARLIRGFTAPGAVKGGTPSAGSLRAMGGYDRLASRSRRNFILLITDGLPNCNANNVNDFEVDPLTCQCTLGAECTAPYTRLGCLDRDESVRAIYELVAKDIRTFVVGFGSELVGGDAETVLNEMAVAGTFPLTCPTGMDAECGANNRCLAGVCEKRFHQAGNAADLEEALQLILAKITETEPCVRKLDSTPSDPELISVSFNGRSIGSGPTTWSYSSTPAGEALVTFTGDLCRQLENSTSENPVQLQFRIIEGL